MFIDFQPGIEQNPWAIQRAGFSPSTFELLVCQASTEPHATLIDIQLSIELYFWVIQHAKLSTSTFELFVVKPQGSGVPATQNRCRRGLSSGDVAAY
jgi:hypothetical protein